MALGPLYVSSYSWQMIKIIFSIIKLVGNMGDYIIYYSTLKFHYFDVCCEGIPILFRGTRSNPIPPFPEDRKCIALTSSEEDEMISHDLHNMILYSSEEECGSTVSLLKIQVESR